MIEACNNVADSFATMLSGGDRRSVGQAALVLAALQRAPQRLVELFSCLDLPDALIRMRAFDVLEKYTLSRPEALGPLKEALLDGSLDDGTAEVRWHLHALRTRLPLDLDEARQVMTQVEADVVHHKSRIVRVMALQGAHDLARRHPVLQTRAQALLALAEAMPIPALRARARKLKG